MGNAMSVLLLASLLMPGPQTAAARSAAARREFRKVTGFPNGRPGFVIDHEIPLCAGGRDAVSNMRWEPVRESYIKDKYERALCVAMKQQGYVLRPRTQAR